MHVSCLALASHVGNLAQFMVWRAFCTIRTAVSEIIIQICSNNSSLSLYQMCDFIKKLHNGFATPLRPQRASGGVGGGGSMGLLIRVSKICRVVCYQLFFLCNTLYILLTERAAVSGGSSRSKPPLPTHPGERL